MKATQTLIQTIYSSGSDDETSSGELEGVITEISKECLELMDEPEKSQAVPASKVMASLVGTTRTSLPLVTFLVPLIFFM